MTSCNFCVVLQFSLRYHFAFVHYSDGQKPTLAGLPKAPIWRLSIQKELLCGVGRSLSKSNGLLILVFNSLTSHLVKGELHHQAITCAYF